RCGLSRAAQERHRADPAAQRKRSLTADTCLTLGAARFSSEAQPTTRTQGRATPRAAGTAEDLMSAHHQRTQLVLLAILTAALAALVALAGGARVETA